jgi:methylmalonyl-CoA mutase cobalamin-binding subunit
MGKAFQPFGTDAAGAKTLPGQNATPAEIIPPWAALLGKTIETEIIPRLVSAFRDGTETSQPCQPNDSAVAQFVALVIADDMEAVRAVADRVIVQTGGRESLLNDLLKPAAIILGEMWERDDCDFTTVTLGVYRLDQIMKETATIADHRAILNGHEHRILLLPAPGEQHSFGLGMVADAFREGGWCVRSGPSATRSQLLRLVRDEWFDVVGLSVTAERALKGLASCIRAVRAASCNAAVCIMLGGYAVTEHPERAMFLGADSMAVSARSALADANLYVETTVTNGLRQSKTRLVDIG